MLQGLKFLSKKGFNPQNNTNRKRVWEAEQASKTEKERLRKRQVQLKREKEDEELSRVTRGELGGSQATLRFMYDAPPGADKKEKNEKLSLKKSAFDINNNNNNNAERGAANNCASLVDADVGCDPAAEAFRRMLAASAQGNVTDNLDIEENVGSHSSGFKFTPTLQGSTEDGDLKPAATNAGKTEDARSALEKAVGRKDRSQNLSYQQQIEHFPQLKNAPMAQSMKKVAGAGDGGDNQGNGAMMVQFKPLGVQIQHVRCLACGVWGHAKGDRECAKSGWNPFALPAVASNTNVDTTPKEPTCPTTQERKRDESSGGHKERTGRGSFDRNRTPPSEDSRTLKRRKDDDSDSESSDSTCRDDDRRHRKRHKKSSKKRRKKDEKEYKDKLKKKSKKKKSRRRYDSDSD